MGRNVRCSIGRPGLAPWCQRPSAKASVVPYRGMLRTIEGVYREGKVELAERPNDVGEEVPVLVTFLEPRRVDLRVHGINEAHSAELRARLSTFAADWDGVEMDVYDDYDNARARLQTR